MSPSVHVNLRTKITEMQRVGGATTSIAFSNFCNDKEAILK
jgi:hypothetical protein